MNGHQRQRPKHGDPCVHAMLDAYQRLGFTMHVSQVVAQTTHALPGRAAGSDWCGATKCLRLLVWLSQHVPGAASMFLAAGGMSRLHGVSPAHARCPMQRETHDGCARATPAHG